MTRSSRALPAIIALLGLAAFAGSPAEAKVKRHHVVRAPGVVHREPTFPNYVSNGVDRNPGGDNLYFSDTKSPHYIVGPAWFQRWE
jgi:hypothetical protein